MRRVSTFRCSGKCRVACPPANYRSAPDDRSWRGHCSTPVYEPHDLASWDHRSGARPDDAGLGQAIVTSERVPVRIREALNVESGLNDGGSVPFLLVFLALAAIQEGIEPPSFWIVAVEQIALAWPSVLSSDCRRVADQKRHATGLDDQDV